MLGVFIRSLSVFLLIVVYIHQFCKQVHHLMILILWYTPVESTVEGVVEATPHQEVFLGSRPGYTVHITIFQFRYVSLVVVFYHVLSPTGRL
jgi:hypothetical protein